MSHLTKGKVILYLVGIFLAGTIIGSVTTYGLIGQRAKSLPHKKEMKDRLRKRLESRLELTPTQLGKLDPLISQACGEFHRAGRRSMQQSSKTLSNLLKEISLHLSEDQQQHLQAFETERRELWNRKCRDWDDKRSRHKRSSGR